MATNGSGTFRLVSIALVLFPFFLLLNACGRGGDGNANLFALFVGPEQAIDAGQTTTVTASIVNDSTPGGATFSLSGGGTLSVPTTTMVGTTKKITVQYTAPATATVATVTATSVHTPVQSYSVAITVNPALTITTSSLPTGSINTKYDVTPAASGGTGILKWAIASGSLPTGLSLNASTGEISGTPTTAVTSTFTLSVTDSAPTPVTALKTYSITINPPFPVVGTSALPSGLVGVLYSQQLTYSGGGVGTPTWVITSGSLPATSGLVLSSNGLISGVPTTAGETYQFSVAVTVGTQTSAPVALSIQVSAPLVITTTSLPDGHIHVAYSQQLMCTGGDGSTPQWSIVSGSLPSTLTLSSSGLLSGTPTTAANYTFGVSVTVGSQTSAPVVLTLSVLSTTITSGANASGEVGLPFEFQLTALGGTQPYTYSLAAGSNALPAGLTINPSTGLITGTPTTNSGSPYSGIVVQAADALGAVGTQAMEFTIAAPRGTAANSELNGQYAFVLTGFDPQGNPVASAGEFIADGNGHITGGVVDTNGTAMNSPTANVALTASTYAVGADGRGQLTMATASDSSNYVLALNSVSLGIANGGALTLFDASGNHWSGRFARQTTTAFNIAAINSGFAFGVYGFRAGSTAASSALSGTIGEIQFVGTSAIASSELLSSNGNPTTPIIPSTGTLTVGSNGRGTLSLVLPNSAGTLNFFAYVLSASEMYLLSSDAAGATAVPAHDLLSGMALAQTMQSGTFTTASLSGKSVFYEEKLEETVAGTYVPDVQIGLYSFDGAGNITGSEDRNAAGIVTQNNLAGTYTIAPNGRVSAYIGAYGLGGCLDCAKPAYAFYMAGAGQGFLLDFSTSEGIGALIPQTASSFTAVSFSGSSSLGTNGAITPAGVIKSGVLTADGTSSLTGLLDEASAEQLSPDILLSDSFSISENGRVTLTSTGTSNAVLYLASQGRGWWLDLTSATPVLREVIP